MRVNAKDRNRQIEVERDGYKNIAARLAAALYKIADMDAHDVIDMRQSAAAILGAARMQETELELAAARRERDEALDRLDEANGKLAEMEVAACAVSEAEAK
jgi:hypothetical protein